jgi:hypothetical protein
MMLLHRSRRQSTHQALMLVTMLGTLVRPLISQADVPPPPDSPNAHCTPTEQCPNGIYCRYSIRPGAAPQPGEVPVGESCRTDAKAKGLSRRCRNGGNYAGSELFCPEGETGSWSPAKSAAGLSTSGATASPSDSQPSTSSCGVIAIRKPGSELPMALVAAFVVLIGRRRCGARTHHVRGTCTGK